MVRKILNFILWPYTKVRQEMAFRKRLKELRDRDPFVYEDR